MEAVKQPMLATGPLFSKPGETAKNGSSVEHMYEKTTQTPRIKHF